MGFKIKVFVITGSKQQKIEKLDQNSYKIWTSSKPIEGQANKDILGKFGKYFGVKKIDIKIISGEKSKIKILEIKK